MATFNLRGEPALKAKVKQVALNRHGGQRRFLLLTVGFDHKGAIENVYRLIRRSIVTRVIDNRRRRANVVNFRRY